PILGGSVTPPPQRRPEVVLDPQDDVLRGAISTVPVRRWRGVPTRAGPTEIRHQQASAAGTSPRVKPAGGHNLLAPAAIPAIDGHSPPHETHAGQGQYGYRHSAHYRPSLQSHRRMLHLWPFRLICREVQGIRRPRIPGFFSTRPT